MTPIPWDPNGVAWPHEPKCETCKRFDADCDCAANAEALETAEAFWPLQVEAIRLMDEDADA